MKKPQGPPPGGRQKRMARGRRTPAVYNCPCCRADVTFCWKCNCGFMICQECMLENTWGMTCNHVTWTCPDCGALRSY
ncbi:MAG: hypothetical protein GY762_02860 [Proteobacteria bacterium]|nr:hypothetical protein [Pseudomonadota bacterium]